MSGLDYEGKQLSVSAILSMTLRPNFYISDVSTRVQKITYKQRRVSAYLKQKGIVNNKSNTGFDTDEAS